MKKQATLQIDWANKTLNLSLDDENKHYTYDFGKTETMKSLLERARQQLNKQTGIKLEPLTLAHRNNKYDYYTALYI